MSKKKKTLPMLAKKEISQSGFAAGLHAGRYDSSACCAPSSKTNPPPSN